MAKRNNRNKTATEQKAEEVTESPVQTTEEQLEGPLSADEPTEETTEEQPMFADNGEREDAIDDALEFVNGQGSDESATGAVSDINLNISGENNVEAMSAAEFIATTNERIADDHGLNDPITQESEVMKLTPGETLEGFNPSYEFLERTCGSCLFQKNGKCLVGPATIDKAGDVGSQMIYSPYTEYRSVAKKVTPKRNFNNETHEEYEERSKAESTYQFNDACGQYVGKPARIEATPESIAELMVGPGS